MYKINEKQFNEMPQELKILYEKLPNHSSDEVVSKFPDTKPSKLGKGNGDHFVEVTKMVELGSASRFFYCAKASKSERNKGLDGFEEKVGKFGNQKNGEDIGNDSVNDKFTVQPKANHHPTVKPIKLMQYLCRLITPNGGTVLDPYMGSGSTGIAAKQEEFSFIGIELDSEYFKIAEARIKHN